MTLAKALPWLLAAALAAYASIVTGRYLDKRDEMTTFKAQVEQMGAAAQAAADQAKTDAEDNLKKVQAANEKKLPAIRANAVARYLDRLRKSDASGGSVPTNAAGVGVDDGAGKECVPDRRFVTDAAEDAAKVEAFRAYCILNNCPVIP